jgi:hypothetical protein
MMRALQWAWLLLVPAVSYTEPSGSVRYLMTESVSTLDFGLYQLGNRLTQAKVTVSGMTEPADLSANAQYDWDRNRIVVYLSVFSNSRAVKTVTAKDLCRAAINNARMYSGVDPSKGSPYPQMQTAAALFQPQAFAKKNAPEHLSDEILGIIEFRAHVYIVTEKGTLAPNLTCEGRLLSTETMFAE